MKFKILLVYTLAMAFYSLNSHANSSEPVPFAQWKEQQTVEAKNHVVRLSNRIHLIKTGRYKAEDIVSQSEQEPLFGTDEEKEYQSLKDFKETAKIDEETIKKAEEKVLKTAEERMKVALGNLQYAKELSIDDYLAVYLSRFKDDEEALKKVLSKFSKEELLEVIKNQMNSPNNSQAQVRPSSILSVLQAPPADAEKSGKNL